MPLSDTAVRRQVDLSGLKKKFDRLKVSWSAQTMRDATLSLAKRFFFDPSQALVPVDTGKLKASGKIKLVGRAADNLAVVISYDTPYAVYVHEIPPSLAYHEPPTQWKFLSTPIRENKSAFIRGLKGEYLSRYGRRKR